MPHSIPVRLKYAGSKIYGYSPEAPAGSSTFRVLAKNQPDIARLLKPPVFRAEVWMPRAVFRELVTTGDLAHRWVAVYKACEPGDEWTWMRHPLGKVRG